MSVQLISKVGGAITGMTEWAASQTGPNAAAWQAMAADHSTKINTVPGYTPARTPEFDAMIEQYLADCNLEIVFTEDTE